MTKTSRRNRAAVDELPAAARSYLEGFKKQRREAHDCAIALAQHDRADFTSDELERILPATVAGWNENAQRFGCLLAARQAGPITLQFVPLCAGAGGQALGQLLMRLTSPNEPRAVKLMLDLFLTASTTEYDEQQFRQNAKGRNGEWNRRVRKTDLGAVLRDAIEAKKQAADRAEGRQAYSGRQSRLNIQMAHDAIERDIRADPDCKDVAAGWPHRFQHGKVLSPLTPRAAVADGTALEIADAPKDEYKDAPQSGVDAFVPDKRPRGSGIDSRMKGQERGRFGDPD